MNLLNKPYAFCIIIVGLRCLTSEMESGSSVDSETKYDLFDILSSDTEITSRFVELDKIVNSDKSYYPERDILNSPNPDKFLEATCDAYTGRFASRAEFDALITTFRALGGNIVFFPDSTTPDLVVGIKHGDLAVPMCHEGVNRSQIMKKALRILQKMAQERFRKGESFVLTKPHGAYGGADPYLKQVTLTPENCYDYIYGNLGDPSKGDWIHECFIDVFGVPKTLRIGEALCEGSLNPSEDDLTEEALKVIEKNRIRQRKRMDSLLYDYRNLVKLCLRRDGRILVFAFCNAVPIFLTRFLEVNAHFEGTFDRLTIIALPWADTLPRAGSREDIALSRHIKGVTETRESLSRMRHAEVYKIYANILKFTSWECKKCTMINSVTEKKCFCESD